LKARQEKDRNSFYSSLKTVKNERRSPPCTGSFPPGGIPIANGREGGIFDSKNKFYPLLQIVLKKINRRK
jgi:hypothetical protein